MTLIVGDELQKNLFFSNGEPHKRGSSFDLTIGAIIDHEGVETEGPFVLQPGHVVQVVSNEVFKLPNTVTGHVTYKTNLTRDGIWALTVGIVDPGWNGPLTTTLLNFSKVNYSIAKGDAFLRVSFFRHQAVADLNLPAHVTPAKYAMEIRKAAMTRFSETFLSQDEMAKKAGDQAIAKIQNSGLIWIAFIGFLFTIIQVTAPVLSSEVQYYFSSERSELGTLIERVKSLEAERDAVDSSKGSLEPKKMGAVSAEEQNGKQQ